MGGEALVVLTDLLAKVLLLDFEQGFRILAFEARR